MKINSLTLHNFGIFANTNELDFTSLKPIVLIGGMNGRGKTTILEAILLALYGRLSFIIAESKLSLSSYLGKLVNKADGSFETYVEISFEINMGEEIDIYSVKRLWSLHNNKPTLKTIVNKNNMFDQFLSDNWDLFIEEVLPCAVAPFFFFDGEKISELASSDKEVEMKSSIKSLLGIDIVEQAISDIYKIINNKKNTIKSDMQTKEINEFEDRIKEADMEVKKAKDTVAELELKKQIVTTKLREAENAFSAMGGNLATNRKDLVIKQSIISEKLDAVNMRIIELVSGDFPLIMIKTLLKDIQDISEKERDQKAIHIALQKLPILYREFNKDKKNDKTFDAFIRFIECNADDEVSIYNLTENGYVRLKTLITSLLARDKEEAIQLLSRKQELLKEQAEIENYLSISIEESIVNNKYQEIIELTKELATISEKYRFADELARSKYIVFKELERQKIKIIEKAVKSIENAVDTQRIVTYAGYSINVLEEYKTKLQESKTKRLAETMTYCFKQIASKQNLISEIHIDPITLDFIYLDDEGKSVNRSSFSAGEKQLLVIAMLWALGICSKKKLPVIIDTPLARLDSNHRETLIKNYFPKASEQTILLSTDSEIHGKYYKLIKQYVGKEFTLVYNDETKQTVVDIGYFGGKK